jgi:hypothetical protein
MICRVCGVEAPTKYVAFYQNIGALVVRFHQSVQGELCKPCIHRYFWKYTAINMALGWWGTLSFCVTPFFIINNLVRYVGCLGMKSPSPDARAAELTEDAVARLRPHTQEIFDRLGQKVKLEQVATETADQVGVTPGQVFLYVQAVTRAAQTKQRQK